MKCLYCTKEVDEKNTSSFPVRGAWFCDLRCWQAYGIRVWRIFRDIPIDADERNIEDDGKLRPFPHDPIWDAERWMKYWRKP